MKIIVDLMVSMVFCLKQFNDEINNELYVINLDEYYDTGTH